jgi:hypothetical protein
MRQKQWIPGPWLNLERYKGTTYYAYLGKYLFNDDYIMLPRAEFYRTREKWFKLYAKENCIFIRPSSGFKTFTGKVFTLEHFDKDWEWVEDFTEPEDIIVITSPKNIKAEWRFISADRKIISGSMYRLNGASKYRREWPDEAIALANEVAQVYEADPMSAIDICQGADDKFYLLEIGSFSCAGIYSCDVEPIVREASRIAEMEHSIAYEGI